MQNTQKTDDLLITIADYVCDYEITSEEAYETARYVLMDTLGCGVLALKYPECTKLLGPVVPGTSVPNGTRVPGTQFELDPVLAAFNIGAMIRWLDYNDTWLAQEWGHPSDNLGGILAAADYISRQRLAEGKTPYLMQDVLTAMIKAHEIQGILALDNSFNKAGLDHVLLVKVATTAVVTNMLGGSRQHVINALSNAWIDNASLRTYRHFPNAGSRKSWAAGDAGSRAVWLAMMAVRGEMGYSTALSAEKWGFQDVLFQGNDITLSRSFASYVMEYILFKVSFPAEFHGQTAVECAIQLHPEVKDRLEDITGIEITTHEAAIRIIDKEGPLYNPADRDHCLQYMTAIGLLFGELNADHYEEETAADPRIDKLRSLMNVTENKTFSKDYLDPSKRSISNAVSVHFSDGTRTETVSIEYPLGHRKRREEAKPFLMDKCRNNLKVRFPVQKVQDLMNSMEDSSSLAAMSVPDFMKQWRM